MEALINDKDFDLEKFAESLVKSGREGVKWERRKLEWIREEREKEAQAKSEAV